MKYQKGMINFISKINIQKFRKRNWDDYYALHYFFKNVFLKKLKNSRTIKIEFDLPKIFIVTAYCLLN